MARELQELGPMVSAQATLTQTFTATLMRSYLGEAYGWTLDAFSSNALYVNSVNPDPTTAVNRWNIEAPEDMDIRAGDYILAIFGEEGSTESLAAGLEKGITVEIMFQRPSMYHVTVCRMGESLGMKLKHFPGASSVFIESTTIGAVSKQAPHVCEGDRIVAVNGVVSDAAALLTALQASDELRLRCTRKPLNDDFDDEDDM
uniref:PDZ domain-containing protein n=1 Tax=Zooxanthella nutricula TaxID=1333877 RepID=A0A7S2VIX0_9DINO|mmetsp:Transcript_78399/g.239828  ORF Transcript_78399/g.239828 Transcript_78399/m.239828 type:complete len:202 (+) Transcript_78399:127-732(+)